MTRARAQLAIYGAAVEPHWGCDGATLITERHNTVTYGLSDQALRVPLLFIELSDQALRAPLLPVELSDQALRVPLLPMELFDQALPYMASCAPLSCLGSCPTRLCARLSYRQGRKTNYFYLFAVAPEIYRIFEKFIEIYINS